MPLIVVRHFQKPNKLLPKSPSLTKELLLVPKI